MDQGAIVAALRERKIKQIEVAGLLGITPPKVSKSFSGERRFTANETIVLLRFLGHREPEVLPMPKMPSATPDTPGLEATFRDGVRMLPVIGLVPAGNWRESIETPRGYMPSPEPDLPSTVFVVEIEGDSLNLIAPPGTRLVIDPADKRLISGKLYVVRNTAGEVTAKRYLSDPARLAPCSDNPVHREIMLGEEEPGEIVGRALWMSSRL